MQGRITIYADYVRNHISKNIFGHFMEHSGKVIYESVYDPDSSLADEDGFRTDVLEVLREVGTPMLRYPGGNFVSNYHWEHGIGPKEKRPKMFDYAWLAEDDNRFGTVEFIKLCRKVGAEPYICVNMGSGTAEEAMHWVEFCNGTGDTYYANLRREQGYDEPFNVKYWGLGNELYGDWQFGKCSATDYAKKAADFAKAMKWVDPTIELVACGYDISSEWNYIVAKALKPLISHIAIHHYSIGYGVFVDENYKQCMYIPEYLDKLTKLTHADILAGTDDALSNIKVSWDEWNTHAWGLEREELDEKYTLRTAVMTATILHSFIRNSNIVEIASYSPFVNVCGAISVKENEVLKRSQYYVFKLLRDAFAECSGYVESRVDCRSHELEEVIDYSNRLPAPKFSLDAKSKARIVETPDIDCASAISQDGNILTVSVINKSETDDYELDLTVWGMDLCLTDVKNYKICNADFDAANTMDDKNQVKIEECIVDVSNNKIMVEKHSIQVFQFAINE